MQQYDINSLPSNRQLNINNHDPNNYQDKNYNFTNKNQNNNYYQSSTQNCNNSNNDNSYCPPIPLNNGPNQNYPTNSGPNYNNNISNPNVSLSHKLMLLNNRISNLLNMLNCIIWFMLILSSLSLVGTIASYSKEARMMTKDDTSALFKIYSFLLTVLYVVTYAYAIQALSKQSSEMTSIVEKLLIALLVSNLLNCCWAIALSASLLSWCGEVFFAILNYICFTQVKEAVEVFREKEVCQARYNITIM